MTDIFFSYNSADRERVRPIHDAFEQEGFDVFWDQENPPGIDWDIWIRQHLTESKCALVFWSTQSIRSDNVRHEAKIAKDQHKLVPVLLEPLTSGQFPMGLYTLQAANLADWKGDPDHGGWRRLRYEVEAKLTPLWVKRQIAELEAELVAERARRETAERRDKVLQAQIQKLAQAQEDLQRERNTVEDEVTALKATVEDLKRARSAAEANAAELSQRLGDTEGQRQAVVEELKRAEANAAELSQRLNDSEAQRQALEQKCESAIDRAKAAEVKLQNLEAELGTLRPPKIWQTIREWRMASTRNNQRLEDLALEPPNKPSDPIFARDPRYGLGFFMFAVLAVVFFLVSLGSQTGGAIWFIVGGICGYVAYRFYVKWKLTR